MSIIRPIRGMQIKTKGMSISDMVYNKSHHSKTGETINAENERKGNLPRLPVKR